MPGVRSNLITFWKFAKNMDSDITIDDLVNEADTVSNSRGRYGIAEWFGRDVTIMSSDERERAAGIALGHIKEKPVCPFMTTLTSEPKCNKKGGVCTIRKYEVGSDGEIVIQKDGIVATVCPARFLGKNQEGHSALRWVSTKMLDTEQATIVKETPFLQQLLSSAAKQKRHKASFQPDLDISYSDSDSDSSPKDALPDEGKKAGRIDWLLMDSATIGNSDPKWCALETQAVYFSGDNMGAEFSAYLNAPRSVIFPVGFRRPDYRSSGPKRLAPQLSVKVPVLRGWGKKVAVLVDRYFFESMCDLPEAYSRGRNDSEKRDNCEVAWFVVDYDQNMKLILKEIRFSTLTASVDALNATEPMSKEKFNIDLNKLVSDHRKIGKKVFISEL